MQYPPSQTHSNLEVSEDVGSGSAVGDAPVVADDADSTLALSYDIEGLNDDLFNIDSIGQIKTRKSLNHEDPRCYDDSNPSDTTCNYSVRVKVSDRDNGSHFINVTISVTDVEEPPSAPATPTVTATADTGRSLEVTWNELTNTGPSITAYQVAYRKYRQGSNSDEYQVIDHQSTERKVTIATIGNPAVNLEPQTQYEVRVRATNGEGTADQGETTLGRLFPTSPRYDRLEQRKAGLRKHRLPHHAGSGGKHAVRAERRQRGRGHGRGSRKQADLQSRGPRQGLVHITEHRSDTDQVGRDV